jgi:hypothetical protein
MTWWTRTALASAVACMVLAGVLPAPATAGAQHTAAPQAATAERLVSYLAVFRSTDPRAEQQWEGRLLAAPTAEFDVANYGIDKNDPGRLDLVVEDAQTRMTLELTVPAGERLRPGSFTDLAHLRSTDQGTVRVVADSADCGFRGGSFRIRDIAFAADSSVSRLWAVFEHRCGPQHLDLFGEIKLNMPVSGPVVVAPETLAFSETSPGVPARARVWALDERGTALPVTSAAVTGPGAPDFRASVGACGPPTAPPGSSGTACQVAVGFAPAAGGQRNATLTIRTARGAGTVALSGIAASGTTRFAFSSPSGEPIGQGTSDDLGPDEALFSVWRNTTDGQEGIGAWIRARDGRRWEVAFAGPRGRPLTAGTVVTIAQQPYDPAAGGFRVTGNGRGCSVVGTAWVDQVGYDPHGALAHLSVRFAQRCVESPHVLTATLDYRALGSGEQAAYGPPALAGWPGSAAPGPGVTPAPHPPVPAPRAATVTTLRGPSVGRFGATAVLTSTVRTTTGKLAAGAPVTLQRRLPGSTAWQRAATKRTSTSGAATFRVTLRGTAAWRVVAARTSTTAASTSSARTVRVRATVGARRPAATARVGARTTFAVAVSPYEKGLRVRPQVCYGTGPWRSLARVPVARDGRAVLSVTFRRAGTYRLRVVRPTTSAIAGATSSPWRVKARR